MRQRQREILLLLSREGRLSVDALVQRFAVSDMTIRRDLAQLERDGRLLRTHGGAVATTGSVWAQERWAPSPAKEAIGCLAATLVRPGQTVMVGTGTTTLEVARCLPCTKGLTVATNSLVVVQALYACGIKILVLGGVVTEGFPSLYGPMAEEMLERLQVDLLFMGCDAADAHRGFYTDDALLAGMERKMIECAARIVVVTESQKFSRRALAQYANPGEIDALVTDAGLTPQDRELLEQQNVQILITEED